MAPPPDVISPLWLAAGAVLFLIAAYVLVRNVMGIRTAFRERLHTLPGGRLWARIGQRLRFSIGIVTGTVLILVSAVYIALALRTAIGLILGR